MHAVELINIICPEHSRTSCSDNNLSNGWALELIELGYNPYRCTRCALLQIANGDKTPEYFSENNYTFEGFL